MWGRWTHKIRDKISLYSFHRYAHYFTADLKQGTSVVCFLLDETKTNVLTVATSAPLVVCWLLRPTHTVCVVRLRTTNPVMKYFTLFRQVKSSISLCLTFAKTVQNSVFIKTVKPFVITYL